jgi:hypothetical protein
MDDLEAKVFGRSEDGTVARPGHGNDTTLGAERPHLAEWSAPRLVSTSGQGRTGAQACARAGAAAVS